MGTYSDELERFIAEAGDDPDDRSSTDEAGRILVEMIRLEGRAARLLAQRRRNEGRPSGGTLAGLPLREAARRVLEEVGRPLHVKELGQRIKARGWSHPRAKHAPEDRISFQLAAQLGRHPDFVRTAPNTFGLSGWERDGRERRQAEPRLPLASGGRAEPVGREIGEHPDRPFEGEETSWRSS